MEGFTKLFSGITRSTVWTYDSDTRVIWIHLMAEADEHGVFVGTIPGLAQAAKVPVDKVRAAIATFLAPDPDSGSKEFEGRRLERVDRGWRLLNHAKYRALRSAEEKRQADRDRIAAKRAAETPRLSQPVATCRESSRPVANVAQAEAEAEAESKSTSPSGPHMDAAGNQERRTPEKRTAAKPIYEAAFADLWARLLAVGRVGNSNKLEAAREWEAVGRPAAAVVVPAWTAYVGTIAADLTPKHVGRWLRLRGHEQEYPRSERPNGGGRASDPATVAFLANARRKAVGG